MSRKHSVADKLSAILILFAFELLFFFLEENSLWFNTADLILFISSIATGAIYFFTKVHSGPNNFFLVDH